MFNHYERYTYPKPVKPEKGYWMALRHKVLSLTKYSLEAYILLTQYFIT
jgi:hypothetical protein